MPYSAESLRTATINAKSPPLLHRGAHSPLGPRRRSSSVTFSAPFMQRSGGKLPRSLMPFASSDDHRILMWITFNVPRCVAAAQPTPLSFGAAVNALASRPHGDLWWRSGADPITTAICFAVGFAPKPIQHIRHHREPPRLRKRQFRRPQPATRLSTNILVRRTRLTLASTRQHALKPRHLCSPCAHLFVVRPLGRG